MTIAIRNIQAQLRDAVNQDVWHLVGQGVPVDGVFGVGTGAEIAGPGSLYTAVLSADLYINKGTKESPMWVLLAGGGGGVPAPPVTSVQFNGGGVFDGDSGFLYDDAANAIMLGQSPFPPQGRIRIGTGGTPGNYTIANSAIMWYDAAGNEQGKIYMTDTDDVNFGAANIFMGPLAGANFVSNNVDAGASNIGIGLRALNQLIQGAKNTAVGIGAGQNIESDENTAFGFWTLERQTGGGGNTAIGANAGFRVGTDTLLTFLGKFSDKDNFANPPITNSTGVGAGTVVTASNQVVIGDQFVTQVFFGSVAANANLNAKTYSGTEIAIPAAPAANGFVMFAKDNGAGKTQLCVRFNTGVEQVMATQP